MGGTSGASSSAPTKWWYVEERGNLTSLFTPACTRANTTPPLFLYGVENVLLRKSFSVPARGKDPRGDAWPFFANVSGLTGPSKRVCITVLPLEGDSKVMVRLGLRFLGRARWAAKGVWDKVCELFRLLDDGGVVQARCLLWANTLAGPTDLLFEAFVGAIGRSRRWDEGECS